MRCGPTLTVEKLKWFVHAGCVVIAMTDKTDKNTINNLYAKPHMDMGADTSGSSLHRSTRLAPKGPSLSDMWDMAHGVSAGAHGRIATTQVRSQEPVNSDELKIMTLEEWKDSLPPEHGGAK